MAWIFQTDGDYVNFNGGGNIWRLHKDSSCITWHWDESGDLFFDVYDSEFVVKAANIADVIIDGVPLSAASDFPGAIRPVFRGLTPYLLKVTVTLTDVQIKTLPTTRVDINSAPESGKTYLFMGAQYHLTCVADYTNISASSYLKINLGANSQGVSQRLDTGVLAYSNVDTLGFVGAGGSVGGSALFGNYSAKTDYDGAGFSIKATNSGGNFTGGNSGNSLKITVYYTIVDL